MKKLFFSILLVVAFAFPGASFANPPTSQFTPPLNPGIQTLTSCDNNTEDCYTLLEALPQKQADGTYKYIKSFNTSASGSDQGIGGFLNFIFQIAIGIAGVIGVVMLTVFGFQYAAQDKNINTLAELRNKITNVIFGILLLLGIFIILRTINPDLLIVEPDIEKQMLSIEAEKEDIPDNVVTNITTGQSSACKGGITSINTATQNGLLICADVADKWKQLVAAAKSEGIKLTAYGGRTMKTQIELRKLNCGPRKGVPATTQYEIYQKPSGQCHPGTARPGLSMHQTGLALDIQYNSNRSICFSKNSTRANTNKCRNSGNKGFLWLEKNANKYGFYNLNTPNLAEAWHWSINGR